MFPNKLDAICLYFQFVGNARSCFIFLDYPADIWHTETSDCNVV